MDKRIDEMMADAAKRKKQTHAERRERIATAALSGMLNRQDAWEDPDKAAKWSVEYADALIAALDAEPGKEEE